ncbi:type II secretion system F family protein [Mesobacillus harenae]|uniref:type II secretion system F family protein n=1 Tax=Mesobacillus harenae TaxID=2213203 RepID=UPI0015806F61|nr:type II secretion system F family protein [Mesobacillus harenae]
MLNIILLFLTAGFFSLVFAGILFSIFNRQIAFNTRVNQTFGQPGKHASSEAPKEVRKSISSTIIQRYWQRGTQYLNKKLSKSEKKRLEVLLRDAGYPFKSAIDFRLSQLVLGAGGSLLMLFLIVPVIENKSMGWLLTATVGLLFFRYPVFNLGKRKTARIKEINKGMADFFDTVNLLLEAGMGLDLALSDVSRKMTGPLSDEFLQTLEDMKLGMTRREAFYELKKRVPSDSFQSVISSLIQADQLGIGMAKVLGNLTKRIREQRREAAREQAMKAPVKMLFPMVFFIFPSLFIVILGPLVIHLVTKGLGG